jgi:hypothetical protein
MQFCGQWTYNRKTESQLSSSGVLTSVRRLFAVPVALQFPKS